MSWKRPKRAREVGEDLGFRSGLEDVIAKQLAAVGIEGVYETFSIPFAQPAKRRKYTPDFVLPNGIIVESKGRFVTADRSKHIMVKEQHPDLDVRFVFSNPNTRISKQSQTTYAMWADLKGFTYAKGLIPAAWLAEAKNLIALAAITKFKGGK